MVAPAGLFSSPSKDRAHRLGSAPPLHSRSASFHNNVVDDATRNIKPTLSSTARNFSKSIIRRFRRRSFPSLPSEEVSLLSPPDEQLNGEYTRKRDEFAEVVRNWPSYKTRLEQSALTKEATEGLEVFNRLRSRHSIDVEDGEELTSFITDTLRLKQLLDIIFEDHDRQKRQQKLVKRDLTMHVNLQR
ncbi:hypothetical protein BT69DRAFT_1330581 [Atractiella rhizophila]|nr:hypothetical protein BT69DRAFT_1330581 [Atractiella rhizophila]